MDKSDKHTPLLDDSVTNISQTTTCPSLQDLFGMTDEKSPAATDAREQLPPPDKDKDQDDQAKSVLEFVKETLKQDAYFTGYLAVKGFNEEGATFWRKLHMAITAVALFFSIACQFGMIVCMRTSHQDVGDQSWRHFIMELFLNFLDYTPSPDLHSWLLFMGVSIFCLQCMQEQNEASVFWRVAWLEEPDDNKTKIVKWLLWVVKWLLAAIKGIIILLLNVAGVHVLLSSTSNMDVVLNCTALTFVFNIDDIAMKAVCPHYSPPQQRARVEFDKMLKISFRVETSQTRSKESSETSESWTEPSLANWTGWKGCLLLFRFPSLFLFTGQTLLLAFDINKYRWLADFVERCGK